MVAPLRCGDLNWRRRTDAIVDVRRNRPPTLHPHRLARHEQLLRRTDPGVPIALAVRPARLLHRLSATAIAATFGESALSPPSRDPPRPDGRSPNQRRQAKTCASRRRSGRYRRRCQRQRQRQRSTLKHSPRFAVTLGGRLSEPGLRSANEVDAPTGTSVMPLTQICSHVRGHRGAFEPRPEPSIGDTKGSPCDRAVSDSGLTQVRSTVRSCRSMNAARVRGC